MTPRRSEEPCGCRTANECSAPGLPGCRGLKPEHMEPYYDREVLTTVLVYHQRKTIDSVYGCACGWADLGKSHAEHIADVYEQSMAVQ